MTRRDQAPPSADHQLHDALLMARHASGDLSPSESAAAQTQIERCSECRALAGDLRAIAHATAALPAPRRHRDFRLTAEQAAGLRGSFLQRLLRRLASPGAAVLQPLAGTAVAIGLVLVVVGSGLPSGPAAAPGDGPILAGDATPAPTIEDASGAQAAPSPGPLSAPAASETDDSTVATDGGAFGTTEALPDGLGEAAPGAASPPARSAGQPEAPPTRKTYVLPLPTPSPEPISAVGQRRDRDEPTTAAPETSPGPLQAAVMLLGVVLASLGVVLIALRLVARRLDRYPRAR